jgi:hypothetical protein
MLEVGVFVGVEVGPVSVLVGCGELELVGVDVAVEGVYGSDWAMTE